MRISTWLLVLAQVASHAYGGGGGGGKGSKHDVLKIHVPEVIKHQHHTHYVFLHKYPAKKPKEKKKEHHHHKHIHIPNVGYHHKHWYTSHKSSHGHGHGHGHGPGHGHGHPVVVKTTIKHHKPHAPPPPVHKMKHHTPKHHKSHPHRHHHKPKPKKAPAAHKPHHPHHEGHHFDHEDAAYHPVTSGYEVTEAYEGNDPGQYNIPDEYGEVPVEGGEYGNEDDSGSNSFGGSFFSYPQTQGGGHYGHYDSGQSSYDISPYHHAEEPKVHDFGDSHHVDDYGSYGPQFESDFQLQHNGYSDVGHAGHQSDNFGENVPGYSQHHKHFLNEINHGIHKTSYDDSVSKVSTSQDEEGDSGGFHHNFDYGGRHGI